MFARFAKRALQLGRCVPSVHPKPALPYCVRFHSTEGGPPKPPDPDSTDGIVEDDELDAFMLDDELDTIVENVPKMLPQPVAKEGSEEYFTRVQERHSVYFCVDGRTVLRVSSVSQYIASLESGKGEPAPQKYILKERTVDDLGRAYGTGRRKSSVARVWIKEGSGFIIVNEKPLIDYFQYSQREHVLEPFGATATAGDFDVWCTVKGGGMSGQAGAVRLGISRALENFTPSLRPELSRAGMLRRDPRMVERKKPGQHKARKQYQWVKR